MRLLISIALVASTIFIGNILYNSSEANVQQTAPAYAKWGKIAMEKVKEKYPAAKIVDYLHIGRVVGHNTSTEKFKLWLREGNREFGVFVDITFNQQTEKIIDIQLKETDR